MYDHVLRVSESTDTLRDLVSTIVETNLSLRDYRQNQIMKKVTSWAAIIAVPTLDHRLLRPERSLPRLWRDMGCVAVGNAPVRSVRRAVRPVPASRLALTPRPTADPSD